MTAEIQNIGISLGIALYSQIPVPDLSGETGVGFEKIGFGVLVFFLIYFYTKTIFPAAQKQLESQNKRIEELVAEVARLNRLREADQELIERLASKATENDKTNSRVTRQYNNKTDKE